MKDALAKTLGKTAGSVTQTDVEEFVLKGARKKMAMAISSCVEAATSKAEKKACKGSAAKASLAGALGKSATEVIMGSLSCLVV